MVNELLLGLGIWATTGICAIAGVLFGQDLPVPGATEAITEAARHGYEAVLVVMILIFFMSGSFFIVRYQYKRADDDRRAAEARFAAANAEHNAEVLALSEANMNDRSRMAARIDKLEDTLLEARTAEAQRYADLTERVVSAMESVYSKMSSTPYFCPNTERLAKLEAYEASQKQSA
jgi:hypothetical protein